MKQNQTNIIEDVNIVLEDEVIFGSLEIKNGKIVSINQKNKLPKKNKDYIIPGFIDVQINGAYGKEFFSTKKDEFLDICKKLQKLVV